MITISHVSMGFSHLPQNCRQSNDFSETLVAVLGGEGVVRNSPENCRCRICGRAEADSSGVYAGHCNCMQMGLNLYLNTSSLAGSRVSAALTEGQWRLGVHS